MEEMDDINKELEEIAPFLSKLPKINHYTVADSYFDELPTLVMQKIHAQKTKNGFSWAWFLNPYRAAAFAFCMVTMVFGSYFLFKQAAYDKPMPVAQVQKLLEEPVSKESVIDNLDADDLAEALLTAQTRTNDAKPEKTENKKALEKYILDTVDDSALNEVL